jgi:hypothetical protein
MRRAARYTVAESDLVPMIIGKGKSPANNALRLSPAVSAAA